MYVLEYCIYPYNTYNTTLWWNNERNLPYNPKSNTQFKGHITHWLKHPSFEGSLPRMTSITTSHCENCQYHYWSLQELLAFLPITIGFAMADKQTWQSPVTAESARHLSLLLAISIARLVVAGQYPQPFTTYPTQPQGVSAQLSLVTTTTTASYHSKSP